MEENGDETRNPAGFRVFDRVRPDHVPVEREVMDQALDNEIQELAPGPGDVIGALRAAIGLAESYAGAVSPNPPVGCAILDAAGTLLACEAHQRAGDLHAEARAINACRQAGLDARIHTLVVTLEPCNHQGRTAPCVDAILSTPARRIFIGARDPNPRVRGQGAAVLARSGLDVRFADDLTGPAALAAAAACRRLIAPFTKWATSGRPWVTIKTALDSRGGMIPPPGKKTFTSPASLDLAHRLRRRADAVITGSGSILADRPEFTVRRVPDHPGKRRHLVILDRRGRVDQAYCDTAAARGFEVLRLCTLEDALDRLGDAGAVEALVEAGPQLSRSVLDGPLWDEQVIIRQHADPERSDEVTLRVPTGTTRQAGVEGGCDVLGYH